MEITTSYNERCLADPRLSDSMTLVPLRPAFRACWGERLLQRPLFVGAQELATAAADIQRLFDLLASLPQRLFGGDLRRYCDALGLDRGQADLVTRFATTTHPPYGRADLYHDGAGFKLLEFNVASDVGGTQHGQLARALCGWSPFREFAQDHELGYADTAAYVADTLRAAAAPLAQADPAVLVLCAPGGIKKDELILAGLIEILNAYGLRAYLAEPDAIRYRSGRVIAGDAEIHVVLRYFNVDDIAADPAGSDWAEPLLRAHEDGRVVIWTGLDSAAYSNKAALALLSDPKWRPAFSDEELAVTERLLPVTRVLRDRRSVVHGEEINVLDYARRQQSDLIIKPVRGWSGHGIVPGWECSQADWRALVNDRADGSYLIQQRVTPRTEPVLNRRARVVEDWVAVYGMFVTPAGYAGSFGRAVPARSGSVVNYSFNDQATTTTVFTYPE